MYVPLIEVSIKILRTTLINRTRLRTKGQSAGYPQAQIEILKSLYVSFIGLRLTICTKDMYLSLKREDHGIILCWYQLVENRDSRLGCQTSIVRDRAGKREEKWMEPEGRERGWQNMRSFRTMCRLHGSELGRSASISARWVLCTNPSESPPTNRQERDHVCAVNAEWNLQKVQTASHVVIICLVVRGHMARWYPAHSPPPPP